MTKSFDGYWQGKREKEVNSVMYVNLPDNIIGMVFSDIITVNRCYKNTPADNHYITRLLDPA